MGSSLDKLDKLADGIARGEAAEVRRQFASDPRFHGEDRAVSLAALLACAYPALGPTLRGRPDDVIAVARGGLRVKDVKALRRAALALVSDLSDLERVRADLRRFCRREMWRIGARELLPGAESDVDVTARELSDLADVCIDLALREALAWADRRFGVPMTSDGHRCAFAVIGMGKLGGRELNAGSDIDLIPFYETDDGGCLRGELEPRFATGGSSILPGAETSLHEYFVRVTQRMTATLDDPTEDGIVFRVDLRLRPEGSRGPLVNSLAAAEQYYEAWGRTWERAALVRARSVAGDIAFGDEVLAALAPFVWRREVNPGLADEMGSMLLRARAEAKNDVERDLKLGPGGIREAEFFVQTLQLVWGGREPQLRSKNTLEALRRLRARGLVTDRESRELEAAYLTLRRLEHRVQYATGLQTHSVPTDPELLARIARSLGFPATADMMRDLERTKRRVRARFASLSPRSGEARPGLDSLWLALESNREDEVLAALPPDFPEGVSPDLGRHVLALARRPDGPLGSKTRDNLPEFTDALVHSIGDAADPEQAARLLAAFFARLSTPSIYVRALADDMRALRRVVNLFGSSAYLGEALVARPELVDRLIFGRGVPTPESVERAVEEELATVTDRDDPDLFVGALRKAKGRVVMEVGLADLAGELDTRAATATLSALAEATLREALAFALAEKKLPSSGLAILGMGKLGGRELGYGSDLDIIFIYDEDALEADAQERFIRAAQRVLSLVSVPHGAGPGYELDTRLRPSGNQGLLVVSIRAFARYHEGEAQDWERQALIKANFVAGDRLLAERALAVAHVAAYERGAPEPEKLHRIRLRMQYELAGERLPMRRDGTPAYDSVPPPAAPGANPSASRARYDLKLGRGGVVDVEFAVQWLQMKFGRDRRVRTPETEAAIVSLEASGYLDAHHAAVLRDGYRMLRQLELRLRVHHGTGSQWLEEGAPGLISLARRVGMRDGPRGGAAEALLEHYRSVTRDIRSCYLAILGVEEDSPAPVSARSF